MIKQWKKSNESVRSHFHKRVQHMANTIAIFYGSIQCILIEDQMENRKLIVTKFFERLTNENDFSIDDIKVNTIATLRAKSNIGFCRRFRQLQIRWSKCERLYFEGVFSEFKFKLHVKNLNLDSRNFLS